MHTLRRILSAAVVVVTGLVGLVGLVVIAVAVAGAGDKATIRGASIVGVATSGSLVATALDKSPTDCVHAELWNPASNTTIRFGKKLPCDAPSAIRGPSLVGNRLVWATAVGGNQLDWTVWTATTTSPVPKALGTVLGADADGPDPIVIGRPGAGIVAYAIGTKVTALRANGSTEWKQNAPAPVRVLASGDTPVADGLTGVIAADGSAAIVDASGKIVVTGTSSGATDECLMKTGVVGQAPGFIFDTSTSPAKQYPVPKLAKLLDCAGGIVIYRVGSAIKGIRLSTGKTATLVQGPKKALIDGAISAKGLAWATAATVHWRPAAAAFAPLT